MLKRYFWDGRTNTIKDAVADALQGEQHFDLTTNTTYFNTDTHYVNLFKRAFGNQNSISKDNVEKAITQFIISLISVKSEFETRPRTALTADQQAGFAIFMDASKGDCFHCHTDGPYFTFADQNKIFANNALQQTGTSYLFPDNGLGGFTLDQNDNGKFKIPVLRNLSYTAPYMHDGRFSTLEQVINFYSDSLKTSPTVDPLMEKFNNGGAHLTPTEKYQLLQFLKTLDDPAFITNPKFSAP
jgi:cytochrome c peroxidase